MYVRTFMTQSDTIVWKIQLKTLKKKVSMTYSERF